jgi:hypothetical protein
MQEFIDFVSSNPSVVRKHLENKPMTKEIAIALGLVKQDWVVDALIANIPTSGVYSVEQPDMDICGWDNRTRRPVEIVPSHDWTELRGQTTWMYFCTIHSLSI